MNKKQPQSSLEFDFINLIHESGGRANRKLILGFREILRKYRTRGEMLSVKLDKRRRKINWLEHRVHELKRLVPHTAFYRRFTTEKEGYHNNPGLDLVICIEALIRFMRIDANRQLEKMGVKRIR